MALIDVVKWESNEKELVHKFPSEDLRLGTQLVVYSGQTAIFVKGGVVADCFEAGIYTIQSENIPILNKLINIPFGKKSPFQAEVWFVNKLAVLDSKWGTATPIQLEDPKYGIIVPVRSFGQYGIKITNPRLFLETMVGNMATVSTDKIDSYFKGKMMSFFANLISDKMTKDNISVLNINSHLYDMSEYVRASLDGEFAKYGLSMADFSIMSINVPENDSSFQRLKKAKEMATAVNVAGRDIYQMERAFDVLDKSASNESVAGAMMGMGIGLGASVGVGNQMGQNLAAQTAVAPPPIPQPTMYYVVVNGQQQGPYDANAILNYINSKSIAGDTLMWKQGMAAWAKASTFEEFTNSFAACPPPIPTL